MNKIKVIVKPAGRESYEKEIGNSLEALQREVGGYIETLTIFKDLVIICNEEGRLMGLPYNCSVRGAELCGDIVFAGVDGDEFGDVNANVADLKTLFGI